jgi:hypothetical protein
MYGDDSSSLTKNVIATTTKTQLTLDAATTHYVQVQ